MSKYDPLRDFLRRQTTAEVTLTFSEVEKIIGAPLPPSSSTHQWWANVKDRAHGRVQREAWRAAGYDAFLVDGARRVIFRKVG